MRNSKNTEKSARMLIKEKDYTRNLWLLVITSFLAKQRFNICLCCEKQIMMIIIITIIDIDNNNNNISIRHKSKDIEKFWKPLYENKKEYNNDATRMQKYKISINNIKEATYSEITTNEIKSATSKSSNWKSPGLDKLYNF